MTETNYHPGGYPFPIETTRDGVRVELDWIGEGYSGDYDESDPTDLPLVRFTVLQQVEGEWEQVDDASYCTHIPARTPVEQLCVVAEHILAEVESDVRGGKSIKRLCERLSWIRES